MRLLSPIHFLGCIHGKVLVAGTCLAVLIKVCSPLFNQVMKSAFMWQLAADCGELPQRQAADLTLLPLLQQVHVAVGGHAGDKDTAQFWQQQAANHQCEVVLHPALPDRQNFGRQWWNISPAELIDSLDQQRSALPDVAHLKFHGALYNRAQDNVELAQLLGQWMHASAITCCTTLADGCLATACRQHGIAVKAEGYLDRGYVLENNGLRLAPRHANADSLITDHLLWQDRLRTYRKNKCIETVDGKRHATSIDVWTLHTDHLATDNEATDNTRDQRSWHLSVRLKTY